MQFQVKHEIEHLSLQNKTQKRTRWKTGSFKFCNLNVLFTKDLFLWLVLYLHYCLEESYQVYRK